MHKVFAILVAIALTAHASAEDLTVLSGKIVGTTPSAMMNVYLRQLAYQALDRRKAEYEKIKTPAQQIEYQRQKQRLFIEQLGGFPERTPLNARVVGRAQRDGYRIEKIIFESWPRHYVTGVLFLPPGKGPHAAVLVPCGHSANGKAQETYQRVSIFLAKAGLAAFCYDPIGQGERYQILDANGKPRFGPTTEHTLVGVGSILLGTNTARYRIYDGMRAIDYLISRPDIDPKRIGCTGNSGGGTLTSYLMALDERIYCAAPSCYLTNFRRLIDTIGPQDAEQNIFAQIALGLDHPDYVLMRAPRPTLMCVATRDYFDIGGAWDSFREGKRWFTRMGYPERIELVETDMPHGFSPLLRLGSVRWMRRWLLGRDDAITEPDFNIMTDDEMQCTPKGQVLLIEGARSVFDLNAEIADRLASERKELWAKSGKEKMLEKVRETAGIRRASELVPAKVLSRTQVKRGNLAIQKLVLQSESGIVLPALLFVPEKPNGEACLYLHGDGKNEDAGEGGPIEQLARKGCLVLAVDLRGIGETGIATTSRNPREPFGPDSKDYFLAYLVGKSYVGMRAEDILVCAQFLRSDGRATTLRVIAIGEAGPPALHAVALEPALFDSLELQRSIVSWDAVVRTPVTRNQLINTVHGALRYYDLSDLLAAVPAGRVTVKNPADPAGEALK
ncbi:MAG: acetylxylan esterase [Candidatus Sumerlaeia bacterium]|nr:acetylxylan esterase [Candidatus Sumerlaeia bacterium]